MIDCTGRKSFFSLRWQGDSLVVLDQTRLPSEEVYQKLSTEEEVISAIGSMVIRGAPLIGIAGAFALCLWAKRHRGLGAGGSAAEFQLAYSKILHSRPTAVNLRWALDRMKLCFESAVMQGEELFYPLEQEALSIFQEDIEVNRKISELGATLIPDGATILHHCNTGSLATADYGTALGAIRWAHESGKKILVYLDETRPRFQGLALSAWELDRLGIPYKVIVDGASGFVMKQLGADLAIVGCDRVARNGDFANKIGTYNLSLVCRAHSVPFYVACPTSSIDWSLQCGSGIEIEERGAEEVLQSSGVSLGFKDAAVLNPAFDITPAELVTSFVTERGIFQDISDAEGSRAIPH